MFSQENIVTLSKAPFKVVKQINYNAYELSVRLADKKSRSYDVAYLRKVEVYEQRYPGRIPFNQRKKESTSRRYNTNYRIRQMVKILYSNIRDLNLIIRIGFTLEEFTRTNTAQLGSIVNASKTAHNSLE